MLFAWLKRRRRTRVLAAPFPDAWHVHLQNNVGVVALLSDLERQKLRDDLRIVIAETAFEGCGGLEITDEIKVTIAAQASLLLLGFRHDYFERVHTVLVYPAGFRSPEGWTAPHGVVHMDVGNLGEAWHHGTVILAWDSVLAGGRDPRDGRNVVLHEFAHQLDYLDGVADGIPPLRDRTQYRKWHEVMTKEHAQLVAESKHGTPKVLDAYGATDHAEFFAVATECFFEKPLQMRRRHPMLYVMLTEYYCQDPALRYSRTDQACATRADATRKASPAPAGWWRRKPYRGSRKRARPATRPVPIIDWPAWVRIWGIGPEWQREQALGYIDNHLWMIGGVGIALGAFLLHEPWSAPVVLLTILVGTLSVTATWLYVAIRWIDGKTGWADQQAGKEAASFVPESE